MFVTSGARARLLTDERQRFLVDEWPRVLERIERLGLDATELFARKPA
jgi:GntR family transcriptional regulator